MRKKFVIIFFSVFMAFSVVAQNADKIPESKSISSLSVGLTVLNQYPIGEYFEVQKAVLGGGITLEYTLPFLVSNLSFGASFEADYKYFFLDDTSSLKSLNDLVLSLGGFVNIPLDKKNIFSFQPDISYGALFRFKNKKKNTNLNPFYFDSALILKPQFRCLISKKIVLNVYPLYTLTFENNSIFHELGFGFSALWKFPLIKK